MDTEISSSDSSTNTLEVDYEDIVRLFLLELREVKRASGIACEFVAQRMSSILEAQILKENERWKKRLLSLGLTMDKVEDLLARKNPLLEALKKYQFQTTLNSHISSYPEFVAPVEVNAGYDEETQRNESFQYIPIFAYACRSTK